MGSFRTTSVLLCVLLLCVSCLSQKKEKGLGVLRYKVSHGDTLYTIAQKTHVPWPQIMDWNKLINPNRLEVGSLLNLGFTDVEDIENEQPSIKFHQSNKKESWLDDSSNIIWPARGRVTSGFGFRRGKLHAGIDISAPSGSAIFVVDDGVVEDVGHRKGYGRVIVVSHKKGFKTRYAHLKRMNVKKGQILKQGDVIGYMGASGNARGVHLHFEYRSDNDIPLDPKHLLPRVNIASTLVAQQPIKIRKNK